MIILGLGTNVGDRLSYLRQALQLIKKIPTISVKQVSPIYQSDALLLENAPASWDMPYLNLALRCETQLNPHELLQHTKKIEKILGHDAEREWAPRQIDIDILAWDDLILYDDKLHIPHEHLHERPFALWPLVDVAPFWKYPLAGKYHGKTAVEIASAWTSRLTGDAPLHTRQIQQRIDTPELMGILNVTPDSFSDGGAFSVPEKAILHARELVIAGADIIDVGAEATGPGALSLTHETEWQRLQNVLEELLHVRSTMVIPPKISVDTRYAKTAEKALSLGVDFINDQSTLTDPDMASVLTGSQCPVVIMHQLGIPADPQKVLPLSENCVTLVYQWAEQKIAALEKIGISKNRIIVDVGIGFGKTAEQSLELIKRIDTFTSLGVKLMVGHSRKSFLTVFTDKAAALRDIETLAVSLFLTNQSVDYLRVHHVDIYARAMKITKALS